MKRADKIRKLATAIQREIVSCPNDQSTVEGDLCWISGCPTSLVDLLMNHEVPEDMEADVVNQLQCPKCSASFDAWQDVGTKSSFEQDHERVVEQSLHKCRKKLSVFLGFLQKYPMLGAAHSYGKTILREMKKAPRCPIHQSRWFRARKTKEHGFGPPPKEFVGDQRYNTSGQPCWYFSNTPEVAVAEATHSDKEPKAWVQEYEVKNLTGLLDLRSWHAEDERVIDANENYRSPHEALIVALIYSDLLTQRFYSTGADAVAERCQWKPEYLLSRYVSQAAMAAGFTGILCTSVRLQAENLVVFDSEWKPTPIGEPIELSLPQSALELRDSFFWNRGEASYF